jgi:hypothetical protein
MYYTFLESALKDLSNEGLFVVSLCKLQINNRKVIQLRITCIHFECYVLDGEACSLQRLGVIPQTEA